MRSAREAKGDESGRALAGSPGPNLTPMRKLSEVPAAKEPASGKNWRHSERAFPVPKIMVRATKTRARR